MTTSDISAKIKQLRRSPPPFQETFRTPLKDIKRFAETIISAGEIRGGCFVIEQEVFEPKNLMECLRHYEIDPTLRRSALLLAHTQETQDVLQAALADWLDFMFLPEPKSFVMYAVHDEHTTFFAHRRSGITRVVDALSERGFTKLRHTRRFPGS